MMRQLRMKTLKQAIAVLGLLRVDRLIYNQRYRHGGRISITISTTRSIYGYLFISKMRNWFPKPDPRTDISQVSQNYELGCNCIFFNQVSGSFISSLRWPIAMLDMWYPTANCTLLILHLEISLTNLEPLQPYFICLNCSCSVITITITITITIIIPITLTTISTPEALIYLLLPSVASPRPSPRPSQFINSLHKAFSQPSSLLLTVVKFKTVQINRAWFTGRLNQFASLGTWRWCKGSGVRALLALDLMFYSTSSADPFWTFPDQLRLTCW